MASYVAYTDGSCIPNPGNGGWAVVFVDGREMSGAERDSTNNRMELVAIIEALKATPEGSRVTVYSDSQLCVKCGEGRWKRRKNRDLWREYDVLARLRTVRLQWVRGHNGHAMNERADELANAATGAGWRTGV